LSYESASKSAGLKNPKKGKKKNLSNFEAPWISFVAPSALSATLSASLLAESFAAVHAAIPAALLAESFAAVHAAIPAAIPAALPAALLAESFAAVHAEISPDLHAAVHAEIHALQSSFVMRSI
jgi:hypothetical protein